VVEGNDAGMVSAAPPKKLVVAVKKAPAVQPKNTELAEITEKVERVERTGGAGKRYVVQLGFYSDHRLAARARLNLLLAGVDSLIVEERNARGERVYRILQGPFESVLSARRVQASLKQKGVETILRQTEEG